MLEIVALASAVLLPTAPPRAPVPRCCALSSHSREVARLHETLATETSAAKTAGSHAERQIAVFSEAAGFFASDEATPAEVEPNLRAIARATVDIVRGTAGEHRPRVLDVGTGTGALLPFYEEAGLSLSDVTGVDLCGAMLSHARARFPTAKFLERDFLDVPPSADEPYDAIVFNAVFANLFDPRAALAHAAKLLRAGGGVLISHPLGGSFVAQLHASDPSVVPRTLPDAPALTALLVGAPPLRLRSYADDAAQQLYVASLVKSAGVGALPSGLDGRLPALHGPVANGFGRGSRKLGIPTANLPCSLFQQSLAELPCGVYVGWAAVRGGVHKACCNVGFSPTFAGEENPEKIVEAHVMADLGADFYGEQMALLLLGFIREERKFGSFDELLSTIRADIATADAELDTSPLAEAAAAPWLLRQARGAAEGDAAGMELLEPEGLLATPSEPRAEPTAAAATPTGGGSGGARAEEVGPAPPVGFVWGLTL